MNREGWLILFLAADEGPLDPIRIMKGMFLLCKRLKWSQHEPYDFVAYKFGPCSFDIYKDIAALEGSGDVSSELIPGCAWKRYRLTPAGMKRSRSLQAGIAADVASHIMELRKWVTSVNFNELLRRVYKDYPDYAVSSVLPHLGAI